MGADKGEKDERPAHEVTLTVPLLFGRHEVTHAQFKQVTGHFHGSYKAGADRRPVAPITWMGAVIFCNALSEKLGLPKCYTLVGESAVCDVAAAGFRLPTEAEWEYACRAGSTGEYFWGSAIDARYGWYKEQAGGAVREAGTKLPNPWGLYDMVVNADEWCNDWYGPYRPGPQTDPTGPETGTDKVLRGGAIVDTGRFFRSAHRDFGHPLSQKYFHGFRVVRRLPPDAPPPPAGAALPLAPAPFVQDGSAVSRPTPAPSPTPTARPGILVVWCKTPGALVRIEGYDKGKANVPITVHTTGRRLKIEVIAPGKPAMSRTLYKTVNPGKKLQFRVDLEAPGPRDGRKPSPKPAPGSGPGKAATGSGAGTGAESAAGSGIGTDLGSPPPGAAGGAGSPETAPDENGGAGPGDEPGSDRGARKPTPEPAPPEDEGQTGETEEPTEDGDFVNPEDPRSKQASPDADAINHGL